MGRIDIDFGIAKSKVVSLTDAADIVSQAGASKPEALAVTNAPGAVQLYEEEKGMCDLMESLGELVSKDSSDSNAGFSDYQAGDAKMSRKWEQL